MSMFVVLSHWTVLCFTDLTPTPQNTTEYCSARFTDSMQKSPETYVHAQSLTPSKSVWSPSELQWSPN